MSRKFLTGIDLNNQRALNVGDPSGATDGANKQYVDNVARGLNVKGDVTVATTAALGAGTYSSGPKTFTVTATGVQTVDGHALALADDVLVKDQATGSQNGVYTVTTAGATGVSLVLTRRADADSTADLAQGISVTARQGTANGDKLYTLTNDTAPVLDTDALTFAQVGGAGTTYTAGNGLTGTTTFSVLANGTSIDVSSSGVKVADAAGGAGLTVASGILAVGAGTGVTVAADTVGIDTSSVVRKLVFASTTSGASQAYTHSFGNSDVMVQVYEVSTLATVEADVVRTDTNTVTVTFPSTPTANQYRTIVQG